MNTVSRTKTMLIAALLPLVAAPALSHAETIAKTDAMDICVKAFVSNKLEKDRPYSVVTSDAKTFDPQSSTYLIALKATGKHSGKQFARATCVVGRDGVVLTVDGKSVPVVGESTVLSAR